MLCAPHGYETDAGVSAIICAVPTLTPEVLTLQAVYQENCGVLFKSSKQEAQELTAGTVYLHLLSPALPEELV